MRCTWLLKEDMKESYEFYLRKALKPKLGITRLGFMRLEIEAEGPRRVWPLMEDMREQRKDLD